MPLARRQMPRVYQTLGAKIRVAGVTLFELVVTMAIASILASIAIPSFVDMIRTSHLKTHTSDFVTSLSLARSEAARRGNLVTVCKGTDGTGCTTDGGWEQGWIVFSVHLQAQLSLLMVSNIMEKEHQLVICKQCAMHLIMHQKHAIT